MPDLKNHAVQQQAMMEAFFFAYQAFTTKPDEMLARRGLGRVHHRVLFFIARYPGLSVKELLTLLGKKSAEERLASLLMSLSLRLQQRGFSAREFHLSMSRNDIGNYLGLAVETVSRLFTRFQQIGLITVNNKHVRIEDLAALREIAGANRGACTAARTATGASH